MTSLDPRMNPDEMIENIVTYELKGIGTVVSLDDIKMIINRLRREIEIHKSTSMMLNHSQDRLSYLQSLARKMLEYD